MILQLLTTMILQLIYNLWLLCTFVCLCMGDNDESAHARQMILSLWQQGQGLCGGDKYFITATPLECPCDYQKIKVLSDMPLLPQQHSKTLLSGHLHKNTSLQLKSPGFCIYFPSTFRLFLPLSQLRIWNCYIGGLSPGTLRNLRTFLLCPPPLQIWTYDRQQWWRRMLFCLMQEECSTL